MAENSNLARVTELVKRRTEVEHQLASATEATVKRSLKRELRFLSRECQHLVSTLVSNENRSDLQRAVAEGVKRASA